MLHQLQDMLQWDQAQRPTTVQLQSFFASLPDSSPFMAGSWCDQLAEPRESYEGEVDSKGLKKFTPQKEETAYMTAHNFHAVEGQIGHDS